MTTAKSPFMRGKSKDVEDAPDIDMDDIDELLSKLTEEEIEELTGEFDPDNTLLPPSERCKNQTEKSSTGAFNRQKLRDYLERKAKAEKDWEQNSTYVKETKGKVFQPKEKPKPVQSEDNGDEDISTEWDDILQQASEEELVDLAAALGFHSMLNQVQYYASLQDEKIHGGGFTGVAKSQDLKVIADELPNPTDVEASLAQLRENDPKLKHLNLNNIKNHLYNTSLNTLTNISNERLIEVCESLRTNNTLEILEMASVAATDKIGKILAAALTENSTLKTLNIESNFFTGDSLVEIVKAVNRHQSVVELRMTNQKPSVIGNKNEMQISKLIEKNKKLLRFGIHLEFPDARIRVHEQLQKNYDQMRKKRMGKLDEVNGEI